MDTRIPSTGYHHVPDPASAAGTSGNSTASAAHMAPAAHPIKYDLSRKRKFAEFAKTSSAKDITTILRPGKQVLTFEQMLSDPNAAENPEIIATAMRNDQFYREREDRTDLVRMKWCGMDFPAESGWGVGQVNYFIASKLYEMHGDDPKSQAKNCKLITSGENGKWTAMTADGEPADLADGKYIFVRMVDGSIRVSPHSGGGNAHCMLSGHAAYVRYAGEVTFKDGEAVSGCPQSGTYMPPPDRWEKQSGFQCKATYPEGSDFTKAQAEYEKSRILATSAASHHPPSAS